MLWVFQSCYPSKIAIDLNDSRSIKSLIVLPIYSKIDIILDKDKRVKSQNFSSDAEEEIRSKVIQFLPSNLNPIFYKNDSTTEQAITNVCLGLINEINRFKPVSLIPVPDSLFNLMDSLHQDAALFIYHGGFTRTKENLQTESVRRYTIELVSLGFYNLRPLNAYAHMIAFVVNKKTKKISMYKELYWENRDPNEELVIRGLVRDLLLSYFQ